jgi:predicted AAA+ superfamily ATPase
VLRLCHQNIHPEGKPVVLLLDEVEYEENWELDLKQLIDHKRLYRWRAGIPTRAGWPRSRS